MPFPPSVNYDFCYLLCWSRLATSLQQIPASGVSVVHLLFDLLPFLLRYGLLVFGMLVAQLGYGQCTTPINSFPYLEMFESNAGGWTSGGTASDWAWGIPAKATINRAGEGQRCWLTGGLTTATYNGAQASWLQSPCFDFSSLPFPQIRFKVYWETERQFDGAALQYSTDNGASWATAGSASEAPDCRNYNWFNTPAVNFLSPFGAARDGWAGNAQSTVGTCLGGGGSGGWVEAARTLPELGGRPSVIFRFTFGSGTQCNTFDGFGIDSIVISAVPSPTVNFNSTCGSAPNSISFQPVVSACVESFSWNFGDPASGTSNTSNLENPTHVFSIPGTYQVQLTVTGRGAPPATITLPVTILAPQLDILQPIRCAGDNNGVLGVTSVQGGGGPFGYVWNNAPTQTGSTLGGLGPGNYTVTVSGVGACPGTASIALTAPVPLVAQVQVTQPGCGQPLGSAQVQASGGTGSYTYLWNPAVGTGPNAINLVNGNYTVSVTDTRGCSTQQSFSVQPTLPPVVTIGNQRHVVCVGQSTGSAQAIVTSGTPPYQYTWNTTPVQATAIASNLPAGTWQVMVRDAAGCEVRASTTITQPLQALTAATPLVVNPSCGERNGRIIHAADGGVAPYQYNWSVRSVVGPEASGLGPGRYQVVIRDAGGCEINAPTVQLLNSGLPARPFLGNDTTLCARFGGLVLDPGSFTTYVWSTGSSDTAIQVTRSGTYSVQVTTFAGCVGRDTIQVVLETDCGEVFFPSGFSPNGDSQNERFGPLGDIQVMRDYRLQVFNRYGQVVFSATDPLQRWDGRSQGKMQDPQAFTWVAQFRYRGRQARVMRGTVLLLR